MYVIAEKKLQLNSTSLRCRIFYHWWYFNWGGPGPLGPPGYAYASRTPPLPVSPNCCWLAVALFAILALFLNSMLRVSFLIFVVGYIKKCQKKSRQKQDVHQLIKKKMTWNCRKKWQNSLTFLVTVWDFTTMILKRGLKAQSMGYLKLGQSYLTRLALIPFFLTHPI